MAVSKSDTDGSLSVPYGDEQIRFELRRRADRRSGRIAIHVEPDGRVLVDAPADAGVRDIRAVVLARARWIHGHVRAARERLARVVPRDHVSGESWLYLGRRYRLKVVPEPAARPAVRLSGQYLQVIVPQRDPARIARLLDGWYRERARVMLAGRLQAVAEPLPWVRELPPVRLQAMRVQWGSCSPQGRLTLNPHLVKAPRPCIDYVLLHELCHLRNHNHGRRFYALLDRHMPAWQRFKTQLDDMSEVILAG